MTNNPLVSVIIPTYKRTDALKRAIETAIKQIYKGDMEIIIVDDSPAYNTHTENIKTPANRKIKYIYNGKPQGSPHARNIGINKAEGEFIAFLDDDDEWTFEKTEEQVKILNSESFKHINLCVTWILDKRFSRQRINKTPDIINHDHVLDAFNLQSTSAYMFRASALKEIGGFDLSLPSAQEYDLALTLSKKSPIISIPKTYVIQNRTDGQISENWRRKIQGIFAIIKKHKKDYSISNYIKAFGLIIVFFMGYIFGNKIYVIITYFKERHSA
jgi:glycosyltransferase involved in cell wall biosynthesis